MQVNSRFTNSDIEFEAASSAVANVFAEIPGLQWKIWLFNKKKKEAGGIYLFVDKQHADAYVNSGLFKKYQLIRSMRTLAISSLDYWSRRE